MKLGKTTSVIMKSILTTIALTVMFIVSFFTTKIIYSSPPIDSENVELHTDFTEGKGRARIVYPFTVSDPDGKKIPDNASDLIDENANNPINAFKQKDTPKTNIDEETLAANAGIQKNDSIWGGIHYPEDKYSVLTRIKWMAGSLVVIEDGKISGEFKITGERIRNLKDITLRLEVITGEEKEGILSILERWEKEDFSQGVSDYNFACELLGIKTGRSIQLREQYND
jgi:hypothetical protein